MKSKNCFMPFLLLAAILVCFAACEKKSYDVEPPTHVTVLKFKKPEYKNYILVNSGSTDSIVVAMRFNSCEEPVGKSGYSPYWELPDDWLLVDWKWPIFPYKVGLVVLTNQTWDKYPQKEQLPLPKWSLLSEPYVRQPVEKMLHIGVEKLAEYNNVIYPDTMIGFMDNGVGRDGCDICFCENSDLADSLWTVVQTHLSVVIENGDLEKLNVELPF